MWGFEIWQKKKKKTRKFCFTASGGSVIAVSRRELRELETRQKTEENKRCSRFRQTPPGGWYLMSVWTHKGLQMLKSMIFIWYTVKLCPRNLNISGTMDHHQAPTHLTNYSIPATNEEQMVDKSFNQLTNVGPNPNAVLSYVPITAPTAALVNPAAPTWTTW